MPTELSYFWFSLLIHRKVSTEKKKKKKQYCVETSLEQKGKVNT